VNITLSADKELIRKAREYAARHGTSLNRMIRRYLEQLVLDEDKESCAREFEQLAKEHGGSSPEGFVFDRKEAHDRGEQEL
jgi:plasmid stability protein